VSEDATEEIVCGSFTRATWRAFVETYRVDPCTGLPMPGSAFDDSGAWIGDRPTEDFVPPTLTVPPPPRPGIWAPPPAIEPLVKPVVYVNDPDLGLVPAGEPVDNGKLAYLFRTPGRWLSKLAPAEVTSQAGWLIATGFPLAVWAAVAWWLFKKFRR
jgi:hypothetical protein